MLNLGARVKHQETGNIGIVIGFGKRIVNNKCLSTAKVKIISPKSSNKNTVNDLDAKWLPCPQDFRVIYPNSPNKNRLFRPVVKQVRAKTA